MQDPRASQSPSVRHLTVTADEAGQRLDNWLLRIAKGVPKSHIYKLVRSGQVRINGGRVKVSNRLKEGDVVRLPPIRTAENKTVRVPDKLVETLQASVVLDTDDFLVLNKPAGIAVHAGSGLAFGAIDGLRQGFDNPKLELVHRLDRATSGALLIGKSRQSTRTLQAQFRDRLVGKDYLALVDGVWPATRTKVDLPLTANTEHAGERRVMVDLEHGKASVSRFAVLESFPSSTLVQVTLETGRTHQIRVHAAHSGHAVVGDERYGNNQDNQRYRRLGLSRMYLHSAHLDFEWDGELVSCDVPVDAQWQASLRQLRDS